VIDIMELIRRHSGTVAAASAIAGFAVGAFGAFQFVHVRSTPPILLRQATEGDPMATYQQSPGAAGALVLLRNDGTTPVEVTDAAFARTSAAPPLYIAPEMVPPGAEVNVYVPIPGACTNSISSSSTVFAFDDGDPSLPPVQIQVGAHEPGGPTEYVPVQVVGQLAAVMAFCKDSQGSSH
jgi:hypothetical protein